MDNANAATSILNSADEAIPAPKATKPNGRSKSKSSASSAAHAAADAIGLIRDMGKTFQLAASACTVCGMPLRDTVSVSRGIGPDCSNEHYDVDFPITDDMVEEALGYLYSSDLDKPVKLAAKALKDKPRDLCNILVWWSATHLDQAQVVFDCAEVVTSLGFTTMGDRMRERNTNVVISKADDDSGDYIVRCRSNYSVRRNMARVTEARSVARKGRFKYGWRFPASRKGLVWTILGEHFGNEYATVPSKAKPGASAVLLIDATTWRDVRDAFRKAYPRPGTPKATPASGNIVERVGNKANIRTPRRNFDFVDALKAKVPYNNRAWNRTEQMWVVDLGSDPDANLDSLRSLVKSHFGQA